MVWIALTIAVAMAVGVGAERRYGEPASRGARTLLKVMLYVVVPPVAFFNLVRLQLNADLGLGIVLGWLALVLAGAAAYGVGRYLLALDRPETGTLMNVGLQGNTAYLGLPLTAAFLGFDDLGAAVAYDALVQGPVMLLGVFGVGAAFGTKAGTGMRERTGAFLRRNPPLLAAVLALVAPAWMAPDALVDASRVAVFVMLPLGFYGVGVALSEAGGRAALLPPFTRRIAAALGLRLLLAPALLALLAWPLIDLPPAYLLLAATPAGVTSLVVAHAYGLDLRFAAGAIAWSTAVVVVVALAAGAAG